MKKNIIFWLSSTLTLAHGIFCFSEASVRFKPILFKFVKDADKSPLMKAAGQGDAQKVQQLIAQGADVNGNIYGDQPHPGHNVLTFGINSGSEEVVRLLLEAGANVDALTNDYDDKLQPKTRVNELGYAIMVNAPIGIIDLLIKHSKNLNFDYMSVGWTPYLIAQRYGNELAAKALAQAGADTSWYRYRIFKQYIKRYLRHFFGISW